MTDTGAATAPPPLFENAPAPALPAEIAAPEGAVREVIYRNLPEDRQRQLEQRADGHYYPRPATAQPAEKPQFVNNGSPLHVEEPAPETAVETQQADPLAAVPETGDGYQIAPVLSEAFDARSPQLREFREFALSKKLTQGEFDKLLGMAAEYYVPSKQALDAAIAVERGKLGASANKRIETINTFLTAILGHGDQSKAIIMSATATAAGVIGMEKLMSAYTKTEAYAETVRSASPKPDAKLTDAEYSSLSSFAKLDYAQSHDQAQFRPRTAPAKLTDAQYAKLSPAEKLGYAMQHDQRQFRKGAA